MSTIIENLHAMRAQIDAMITAAEADGSGDKMMIQVAKPSKSKAPKADKKPRANAGMPTLHGAWTTHVMKEHSTEATEYKEFLDALIASAKRGELLYTEGQAKVKKGKKQVGDVMDETEAVVGVHTKFVSYWKAQHADEHATFKAEWEAANPKDARVASSKASQASSSDNEGEDGEAAPKQTKKRGAKKHVDMTPEELAADKAKRAAKKAEKAAIKASGEAEERLSACMEAASPVAMKTPSAAIGGSGVQAAPAAPAAEAEEEVEMEQLPFTHKKINYLRLGCMGKDGEPEWADVGDLWLMNADGSRGAYAGILMINGKIDTSAHVMANAPELE